MIQNYIENANFEDTGFAYTLSLMKSIRNFWQKYWQIQRCGRCSIRWQRR